MGELVFDDIFKVENVNPDGKKYDRVSRILAQSERCSIFMLLDVNTEIYPVDKNEKFIMALSPSLQIKTKDGEISIQDKFEYIMHGRVYNIADGGDHTNPGFEVEVYVSFGGLQMMLRGDASHFLKIELDQNLFLLMRKI